MKYYFIGWIVIVTFIQNLPLNAQESHPKTQLVLLGTGTPFANPERSGPSLAIVINEASYVVDCGPGVVRRAAQAARDKKIAALEPAKLRRLFITHLHTDHTAGLSDFIFTPAVLDRNEPLQIIGPPGIRKMTSHIQKAYAEDQAVRINGLEGGNAAGYQVQISEVTKGEVYRDENIRVIAFEVRHGSWKHALGYRFETADKVIVISGDCTYSESLIEMAKGCDILVHEVFSEAGLQKRELKWQQYHSTFHTSTSQVARIGQILQPPLIILTHQLTFGSSYESLLDEIKRTYSGKVVNGEDLAVY
ncbi:MAG: MBL fold metallo-hydrolase [Chitinophagia bacterium]|nr:MBL fold metallo-hydrolase [Chitinophagia bacterium]